MMTHLDATPTDVIAGFTQNAPVDIYGLARELGLKVVEADLGNLSGKIESLGLFGFQITVNSTHPALRRRFTVAHEIAHYVLHRDLIGDGIVDDAMYRSRQSDEIESRANSYAASLLMPSPLVRQFWRVGRRSFAEMSAKFEVSQEVARIRMRELRLQ